VIYSYTNIFYSPTDRQEAWRGKLRSKMFL